MTIIVEITNMKGKIIIPWGKEILSKIVALSIPTYAISYFLFFESFYKELESLIARFWRLQKENEKRIH